MDKITISMSEQMVEFVKSRLATGDYNNTSEYFRDLIRQDQSRQRAAQDLRIMMDKAEQSGISERSEDEIFAAAVEKVKAQGLLRD